VKIPVELLFSPIKDGHFEETGPHSGEWWRGGRVIAEWRRDKNGDAVVTWREQVLPLEHQK
jgi:hypothetical protein